LRHITGTVETNGRSGTALNSVGCSTRDSIVYTPVPFSSGPARSLTASWRHAIHAWRAANNRAFGGNSWEIYGDWSDDPSKLETTIVYLLK